MIRNFEKPKAQNPALAKKRKRVLRDTKVMKDEITPRVILHIEIHKVTVTIHMGMVILRMVMIRMRIVLRPKLIIEDMDINMAVMVQEIKNQLSASAGILHWHLQLVLLLVPKRVVLLLVLQLRNLKVTLVVLGYLAGTLPHHQKCKQKN